MFRILIADDAKDMRAMLRLVLDGDGRFEIVGEASNGDEAVMLAAAQHPDAVILDLTMPVRDGLDTIPQMRSDFPNLRILAFSASGPEMLQEALALGAHGALEKNDVFALPDQLVKVCEG